MAVLGARSSACPRVRRHDFQHWRADADRLAGIRDNGGDHLGALHADLDGTPRLAVGDLLINLEGLAFSASISLLAVISIVASWWRARSVRLAAGACCS
jgi:hypothetical protein